MKIYVENVSVYVGDEYFDNYSYTGKKTKKGEKTYNLDGHCFTFDEAVNYLVNDGMTSSGAFSYIREVL